MLSTLAFAGMIASVMGHGRLTKPLTRVGHTGYENDPIGFAGRPAKQYICRHDAPNAALTPETITAGDELTVQWVTTAAHVGDCALYMSYDGDLPLEDMRWFKIANKQDCKSYSGQDVQFDLPNWLPGGKAVLRWEWYALHVYPTIEFYAQCSDVVVQPSAQALNVADIPTFKVYENGQKTSLPLDGTTGVGFRNAFAGAAQTYAEDSSQFMTGPECALNSDLNDCALTAKGTQGHVALATSTGGTPVTPTENPVAPTEDPSTQPPVSPTEDPSTQPPVYPTADPSTQPPTNGDCSTGLFGAYEQCAGDDFSVSNPNGCPLCPTGYTCTKKSKWFSNCNHSCPAGLGWDCETEGSDGSLPAPTDPATQPPTDPVTQPPTDPATQEPTEEESDCPNGENATCGGASNPNAAHCCQAGLYCKEFSEWHSQCVKL